MGIKIPLKISCDRSGCKEVLEIERDLNELKVDHTTWQIEKPSIYNTGWSLNTIRGYYNNREEYLCPQHTAEYEQLLKKNK